MDWGRKQDGGVVDFIISGITDIVWAFPTQLLAIAFIAALGPSLVNVMLAWHW